MKKEKLTKWIICLTGLLCLYAFISVRSFPLYNLIMSEKLVSGYWDKTRYGECYYFNYIECFREEGLPGAITKYQYDTAQANLSEADLLLFGDSFFDISRGTQFPRMLAGKASKKLHYVYQELPLTYLARNNYRNDSSKTLILGLVERYIPVKFITPHTSDYYVDQRKGLRKMMASVKDLIFYKKSEELYDAMLKRSYLTTFFYTKIATLKFRLFGYISKLTPKYLTDDKKPWLFYYDQVNDENTSFYYQHSDQEMENIGSNIKLLANELKEQYNIDLVFLPVPAQYTLYHHVINNDPYNDFLPKLFKELDSREISYINIYDDFKNYPEIIYYGTDGHWNVKGIEIAVEKTIDYLSQKQPARYNQNANNNLITLAQ